MFYGSYTRGYRAGGFNGRVDAVETAMEIMKAVGQSPVLVRRLAVLGFICAFAEICPQKRQQRQRHKGAGKAQNSQPPDQPWRHHRGDQHHHPYLSSFRTPAQKPYGVGTDNALYTPHGAIAAYKALYELVFKPFFWDKTQHGLHAVEKQRAEC